MPRDYEIDIHISLCVLVSILKIIPVTVELAFNLGLGVLISVGISIAVRTLRSMRFELWKLNFGIA